MKAFRLDWPAPTRRQKFALLSGTSFTVGVGLGLLYLALRPRARITVQ